MRAPARSGIGHGSLRAGPAAAALLVLGLAACSASGEAPGPFGLGSGVERDDTVFLTLATVPNAHMEALFMGRVVRDPAGCLRLDSPDPSTVVWPMDFRLVERDGGLAVLDADGDAVGRIGGEFRFGGGHVPELREEMGVSASTIAVAEERCPGRYWIVGEIPVP